MYFFKTVDERVSKYTVERKVYPLGGQTFSDGTDVNTGIHVSCSKSMRSSYEEGCIFYSKDLKRVHPADGSVSYYKATIFVLDFTAVESEPYKEYQKLLTHIKEISGDKTDSAASEDKMDKPVKTLMDEITKDKTLKAPTPEGDSFYVSPDNWSLLVRNIKNHVNTMIIGPTGTGKTSIVKKLCDKMGINLHVFDMGSMVDPISSLLGVHRLENGESIFDYAKFTQVIQEPCVILLDELSRASYSTMNILFPCLDDRRKLSIEIASGKGVREINIHPDVTFIATANVGSEYTGTNSMDRALTNRFFPIELGNIPAEQEVKVLTARSSVSREDADIIVKIANTLRNLYTKQELSIGISIRETLLVADLVHDGWTIGKAMELVYLPLFEGTKSEGERKIVFATFASY